MKYYLAVSESEEMGGWWDIFTSPKWRHVMLFWPIWDGAMLMHVEFARGQLWIQTFPITVERWILGLDDISVLTEVIEVELDEPEPFYYNLRGLMTCVSVVKAIIGVKVPLCLTPKQLIRMLLNRGGTRVWVEADQAQQKRNDSVKLKLCRGGRQTFSDRRSLRKNGVKPHAAEPSSPHKAGVGERDW